MGDAGFVETGGARLYYEVEGDGHPLNIHAGVPNLPAQTVLGRRHA